MTKKQIPAFLKYLLKQCLHNDGRQVAAALTYTTLFAVVPLTVVLFTVIRSIPALSGIDVELQEFIFSHFIPSSGTEVMSYLNSFAAKTSQLTAIGIGILLITAVLLLRTIERGINQIWGIKDTRRGLTSFLMYWAIISLGPLLLATGFVISSWLLTSSFLSETLQWLSLDGKLFSLIPWLLNWAAFSLLYIVVPNCYVPWRAGVTGAFFASALFELAKYGFTWFVSNLSGYQLIYGAFAIIPLFLLWVHISWLITLMGVETVKALVTWHSTQKRPDESVVFQALRILALLWKAHVKGEAISADALRSFLSAIQCRHWSDIRQFFLDQKLIAINDQGDFLVGRDYNQVRVHELIQQAPWGLSTWNQQLSFHSQEHWQTQLGDQWQDVEQTLSETFPQSLQQLLTSIEPSKPV